MNRETEITVFRARPRPATVVALHRESAQLAGRAPAAAAAATPAAASWLLQGAGTRVRRLPWL